MSKMKNYMMDIEEFCDLVDEYFQSMEAIKGGNKIGLA